MSKRVKDEAPIVEDVTDVTIEETTVTTKTNKAKWNGPAFIWLDGIKEQPGKWEKERIETMCAKYPRLSRRFC